MLWHIRAPNLHDFRIANTLLQSQNRLFLRFEVSERVVLRDVRLRVPSHALCLECTHRSTVLCDRLASERVEAEALFVDAQSDRGRPQEMLVQVAVVAAHTSLLPSTDMRRGFENELFLASWTGKQRRKVIDENTHRYVADGPPAFHHVNVAAVPALPDHNLFGSEVDVFSLQPENLADPKRAVECDFATSPA